MKVKKGFRLRDVCGEKIIVADGIANIDFSRIISMNESSAYLWKHIEDGSDFTAETLTKLLLDEYEIDEATAKADSEKLMAMWKEAGIVED